MTGSGDHRVFLRLVNLAEVSHARVAIIPDLVLVMRTGRCHRCPCRETHPCRSRDMLHSWKTPPKRSRLRMSSWQGRLDRRSVPATAVTAGRSRCPVPAVPVVELLELAQGS